MPDCAGCRALWSPRLPELTGPSETGIPGGSKCALAHPECVTDGGRVPVATVEDWVSRLRRGFVKVTFAVQPRAEGAPWVGVAVADTPRSLPAVPVISGMGVHESRQTAIDIATAEAVERYNMLFHRASPQPTRRLGGSAVALDRAAAVRRAEAEFLERLGIAKLCAGGSTAEAEPWPADPSLRATALALDRAELAGRIYAAPLSPDFWLYAVALVDTRGRLVALGTAAAGAANVARHRAIAEAYGMWAASTADMQSPVTRSDALLWDALRIPATGIQSFLLDAQPTMRVSDIGTRLSDECGLHAVAVQAS
jgi:hypothetical protein